MSLFLNSVLTEHVHLEPRNVALIGNRIFADIIKLRYHRFRAALIQSLVSF